MIQADAEIGKCGEVDVLSGCRVLVELGLQSLKLGVEIGEIFGYRVFDGGLVVERVVVLMQTSV